VSGLVQSSGSFFPPPVVSPPFEVPEVARGDLVDHLAALGFTEENFAEQQPRWRWRLINVAVSGGSGRGHHMAPAQLHYLRAELDFRMLHVRLAAMLRHIERLVRQRFAPDAGDDVVAMKGAAVEKGRGAGGEEGSHAGSMPSLLSSQAVGLGMTTAVCSPFDRILPVRILRNTCHSGDTGCALRIRLPLALLCLASRSEVFTRLHYIMLSSALRWTHVLSDPLWHANVTARSRGGQHQITVYRLSGTGEEGSKGGAAVVLRQASPTCRSCA
jgi:hypothetical protein